MPERSYILTLGMRSAARASRRRRGLHKESNPAVGWYANRSPCPRPPFLISPPRSGCRHVRAPGVPNVEGKILRPSTVVLVALGGSLHGREDPIQPLHLRRPALRGGRRQGRLATAANQRRELESSGYRGPKGPGRVSIPSGGRGVGGRFSGGVNHRVTNPAFGRRTNRHPEAGNQRPTPPKGRGSDLRERRLLSRRALAWDASCDGRAPRQASDDSDLFRDGTRGTPFPSIHPSIRYNLV